MGYKQTVVRSFLQAKKAKKRAQFEKVQQAQQG
jgi:hypothetical protein